jgi:2-(1,2-epoxy-1,2-dihydrophenyl)acetyl-CoA isomerase
MTSAILQEQSGDVITLRLNTPATLNALTPEAGHELTNLLQSAYRTARAVVLAGHPRAFCAGMALSNTMNPSDPQYDAGAPLEVSFNPLMRTIQESPVPIVAAVRGAAAGVGASIALACDIIVAGETAYFLQAFRRIGLVPDGGAAFLLSRSVGRVRAMELMLLGERLAAARAFEWGLISRVVPDEEVEGTSAALASQLANGPTTALALIRKAAWSALSSEWNAQLELERKLQRDAGRHPDHAEGIAAFVAKREPVFS